MKPLLYTLACFLLAVLLTMQANSQTLTRQPGETAEAFVKRTFSIDELPHPVIETGEWDSTKKVILFFKEIYPQADVIGYLLTPAGNNNYIATLVDTFKREGAVLIPSIETVFFANADKDSAREIVVIVKAMAWLPRTADESWQGDFYDTYVYDNPVIAHPVKRLLYFEKLSEKLSNGFEGEKYDKKTGKLIKKETAKYKTVSSIRQALKDMGYPPVAPKH